jgi:hypothetical protein
MYLSVNDQTFDVTSRDQLRAALARLETEEFCDTWLRATTFPALCALTNANGGWLMYLREEGDAGFSSRNPRYSGDAGKLLRYRLSNGQIDEYPASWAVSKLEIFEALAHFLEHECRPPFIVWHDDGI